MFSLHRIPKYTKFQCIVAPLLLDEQASEGVGAGRPRKRERLPNWGAFPNSAKVGN